MKCQNNNCDKEVKVGYFGALGTYCSNECRIDCQNDQFNNVFRVDREKNSLTKQFRDRVLADVKHGDSKLTIARRYKISSTTIYDILRRRKDDIENKLFQMHQRKQKVWDT